MSGKAEIAKTVSGTVSGTVQPIRIADAQKHIRHVFVRDLVLDARIGVYNHERGGAQRIRINLDLSVAEPNHAIGDDLREVVCYEAVINDAKAVIAEGHINLVETMAEKIAARVLTRGGTLAVRVRIEKLDVIAEAESVGIEIERSL